MYSSFRECCEQVLRIPPEPAPPPGDEGSTRLFRAAPNFYKYLLVKWGVVTAFSLIPELTVLITLTAVFVKFGNELQRWMLALLLIPVVMFVLFVLIHLVLLAILRLEYEKRWYVVTDRSLRIREGVVSVREMTVTFANIQNISISQGPIQRLLGIADLQVDTAGGGGAANAKQVAQNLHTAWFRGIDNANEVRELIQERLRHLKDSGLGDHEELVSGLPKAGPVSPALLAALREVHAEASALRRVVGQQPSRAR